MRVGRPEINSASDALLKTTVDNLASDAGLKTTKEKGWIISNPHNDGLKSQGLVGRKTA